MATTPASTWITTTRHAVTGFAQGATVVLLATLALPCAAWPAPPSTPGKQAPCQNVRFEDGSTARVRVSPSGSWSRCEYSFELRLKAGATRKPIEVRTATPDRCYVWVAESALAKDKGLIEKAWSACVDASHAEAEKQPVVRR